MKKYLYTENELPSICGSKVTAQKDTQKDTQTDLSEIIHTWMVIKVTYEMNSSLLLENGSIITQDNMYLVEPKARFVQFLNYQFGFHLEELPLQMT